MFMQLNMRIKKNVDAREILIWKRYSMLDLQQI